MGPPRFRCATLIWCYKGFHFGLKTNYLLQKPAALDALNKIHSGRHSIGKLATDRRGRNQALPHGCLGALRITENPSPCMSTYVKTHKSTLFSTPYV
ncbi:hypothetical protein GQ457_09G014080 [Hibiscus cannabinus]